MSERRYREPAEARAVRAMNGHDNKSKSAKNWLLGFVIVCAIIGAFMVYGVLSGDNYGKLPLGLDAVTVRRTCYFVQFTPDGQVHEVCQDGTVGIFTPVEESPLTGGQQGSQ